MARISISEAARRRYAARMTIYRAIKDGRLTPLRQGTVQRDLGPGTGTRNAVIALYGRLAWDTGQAGDAHQRTAQGAIYYCRIWRITQLRAAPGACDWA